MWFGIWTHWADCYLPKMERMHIKLASNRLPAEKKELTHEGGGERIDS